MKILIVLFSFLAAGHVRAQSKAPNWSELEVETAYRVAADIKLEDGTVIPAARELVLLDVESLDVPALLLKFKDTACTNMDLKTPMSLFCFETKCRVRKQVCNKRIRFLKVYK